VARSGRFDSVFFGPVFVSSTKSDRPALSRTELAAVAQYLLARTPAERRTKVIALSGITPERVEACQAMGFDGVATISGVYGPNGVVERDLRARWIESGVNLGPNAKRMPRVSSARSESALHLMCLTQDGERFDHVEQATQLCAAGAKLIQLRVKGAEPTRWTEIAAAVTRVCHAHGARCLINDRPDIALAVGADGAHVGQSDGDWREARRLLGSDRWLGGTVNDVAGARRAVEAGCLDYVGVGPFRFTTTKQKLAPVLGAEGVREVIAALDGLPAWVIGGIQTSDLPAVAATGAAGVAVSSYLHRGASIAERYRALAQAWPDARAELTEPSLSVS
jgi:thiamine-phosphate pyrophosphorylase